MEVGGIVSSAYSADTGAAGNRTCIVSADDVVGCVAGDSAYFVVSRNRSRIVAGGDQSATTAGIARNAARALCTADRTCVEAAVGFVGIEPHNASGQVGAAYIACVAALVNCSVIIVAPAYSAGGCLLGTAAVNASRIDASAYNCFF